MKQAALKRLAAEGFKSLPGDHTLYCLEVLATISRKGAKMLC
jgi:hypothetical protein